VTERLGRWRRQGKTIQIDWKVMHDASIESEKRATPMSMVIFDPERFKLWVAPQGSDPKISLGIDADFLALATPLATPKARPGPVRRLLNAVASHIP